MAVAPPAVDEPAPQPAAPSTSTTAAHRITRRGSAGRDTVPETTSRADRGDGRGGGSRSGRRVLARRRAVSQCARRRAGSALMVLRVRTSAALARRDLRPRLVDEGVDVVGAGRGPARSLRPAALSLSISKVRQRRRTWCEDRARRTRRV